jgi:hypothetical protein
MVYGGVQRCSPATGCHLARGYVPIPAGIPMADDQPLTLGSLLAAEVHHA